MNGKDKVMPIDIGRDIGPRIEGKPKPPYFVMLMVILPIFSGCFVFWAMLNLSLDIDAGNILKASMVGVVTALVSFAINKFAIDWSTELAASGMPLVGVFGATSILVVGVCLWFFSFGGINLPDVRSLRLADHHTALTQYSESEYGKASQATRIVPVIRAISSDLAHLAQCEVSTGCVSGKGGAGTLSRLLEEKARRAAGIATQLDAGTAILAVSVSRINESLGNYQTILNDKSISDLKRRQALIKNDAETGRLIAVMKEAVPVSLLSAYAKELAQQVNIPGKARESGIVTTILRQHGEALSSVIASIKGETAIRPAFPATAGLGDTLAYLGNFAGTAGVIFIAECVFPLTLFIYTLAFLIRQRERTAKTALVSSTPNKRSAGRPPKTPPHKMNGGHHVE